jgi:glucose-6-phosphate isomerase
MTLTLPRVDARSVGALIALFERAVGFYASLIGINAYHQPGVEAGKKAATHVLDLQVKVLARLTANPQTAEAVAQGLGFADEAETVYLLLEHMAANGRARMTGSGAPASATFCAA